MKSTVAEMKAYEVKLFEKFVQEGENRVLNIIRKFHPEWNINFLEVREEDVSET